MSTQSNFWADAEVTSTYTRAQAIEDGVVVDVSETAREAGIRYPVAVTRAVWDQWITPPADMVAYGQSESGRLWDLLWLLRLAARRGGREMRFSVLFAQKPHSRGRKNVEFRSLCGPGDNMEPVITVMLPDED